MAHDGADWCPSNFDGDRPIESRRGDLLGRHSFAEAIAEQVLSTPPKSGFVGAVAGEWGCGKSSVLNMIDELLKEDGNPAIVLRFNPWLFGGAEDLVARFFGELSAQIRQGTTERLRNVGIGLLRLGQLLAPFSPAPGAAVAANMMGGLAQSWAQNPSLEHARGELADALLEADSKFVVLIDDVDRLYPHEIREVLRLVRLTSELPNITFILAFDWQRVAKSLAKKLREGQQFLEKIVQFKYNVPQVRRKNLDAWLFDRLSGLVGSDQISRLDTHVWVRVYPELIRPLIRNLRDAKRFLFSLPITLGSVGGEVALADILGLEALRVLKPHLFDELRDHAEYLTPSDQREQSFVVREKPIGEIRKSLEEMVGRSGGDRGLLSSTLEILFPATQDFLSGRQPGESSERAWRKDRRIASCQVLRIYLEAGLADGSVPTSTIEDLFGALTDEIEFANLIDALRPPQLAEALERLEAYGHQFPASAIEHAIPILLNCMGNLSPNTENFFDFSERFKAERVVFRLVRAASDSEALAHKLNLIFDKVDSLSGLLYLINTVNRHGAESQLLVDDPRSKALTRRFVHRLKLAETNHLVEEWNPSGLALNPMSWLSGSEMEAFRRTNRQHLREPAYLVAVLRSCATPLYTNGASELRLPWDPLLDAFGPEIKDAILDLDSAIPYRSGDDDREVINVAQKYATGWRPDPLPSEWHDTGY